MTDPCTKPRRRTRTDRSQYRVWIYGAIGLILSGLPTSPPVAAHRDSRVSICIPYFEGSRCAPKGKVAPAYNYGATVVVKGHARPTHGGTVKIERRKGSQPWKVVAKRELDDEGRYRYEWQTRRRDADQGRPYRFRTRLPHHDVSRAQKVYVQFFE